MTGKQGIRLAYISDQKYFRKDRFWYTSGSLTFSPIFKALNVNELIIWGRLYSIDDPVRFFQIPDTDESGKVSFFGPCDQGAGWAGYLRNYVWSIKELKRLVGSADIVWLKLPFFYSMQALRFCSSHQVVVTHMVGDAELTLPEIYPRARLLTRIASVHIRKTLHRADIQAFVSRALARKYASADFQPVISNESRITAAMIRTEPPYKTGPWRALYVGRLSPEKRVQDILAALSYDRQLRLTVIGDGPERGPLQAYARQIHVQERIAWVGFKPWGEGLFQIMRECQALIIASPSEGLPLVIIEALSQGLPVVATNVGGIPEIIHHEKNGFLVPVNRPEEIARCLTRMREDPSLWVGLAQRALADSESLTMERQLNPLLERVRELAARKGYYLDRTLDLH